MNSRTRRTIWSNDAASDLASLSSAKSKAESDCKSSHPQAWKYRLKKDPIGKAAGKPYNNCYSDKMNDYNNTVGVEIAEKKVELAQKKQEELDAKALAVETKQAANATQILSAQAEVASVQASADADTAKASQKKMIIIAGGSLAALILLGVIVMAVKGSGSTATK